MADTRAVQANLADQTGAKSCAFGRVNSISSSESHVPQPPLVSKNSLAIYRPSCKQPALIDEAATTALLDTTLLQSPREHPLGINYPRSKSATPSPPFTLRPFGCFLSFCMSPPLLFKLYRLRFALRFDYSNVHYQCKPNFYRFETSFSYPSNKSTIGLSPLSFANLATCLALISILDSLDSNKIELS